MRHARLGVPEIDQRNAVFPEQPGQVVASVRCDQAVVGLLADPGELRDPRIVRFRQVRDPDFAGVVEAEHEALARRVD